MVPMPMVHILFIRQLPPDSARHSRLLIGQCAVHYQAIVHAGHMAPLKNVNKHTWTMFMLLFGVQFRPFLHVFVNFFDEMLWHISPTN